MENVKTSKLSLVVAFLGASIVICISGCSSSTSPSNSNGASTIIHPKLGSTFTDSTYEKDTNLRIDASTGAVIVYTLTDTSATIAGKSNVFEFTSDVDTIWIHYESNGDVSNDATFAVDGISVGTEWVTLPAQSQGTLPITALNTPIGSDTISVSGAASGTGSETLTIGGHSLTCQKTSISIAAKSHSLGTTTTGTVNNSFAPSIGYLTKYDLSTVGSYLGFNLTSGTYRFLIAYNLK